MNIDNVRDGAAAGTAARVAAVFFRGASVFAGVFGAGGFGGAGFFAAASGLIGAFRGFGAAFSGRFFSGIAPDIVSFRRRRDPLTKLSPSR
jgi:hypothetical protein